MNQQQQNSFPHQLQGAANPSHPSALPIGAPPQNGQSRPGPPHHHPPPPLSTPGQGGQGNPQNNVYSHQQIPPSSRGQFASQHPNDQSHSHLQSFNQNPQAQQTQPAYPQAPLPSAHTTTTNTTNTNTTTTTAHNLQPQLVNQPPVLNNAHSNPNSQTQNFSQSHEPPRINSIGNPSMPNGPMRNPPQLNQGSVGGVSQPINPAQYLNQHESQQHLNKPLGSVHSGAISPNSTPPSHGRVINSMPPPTHQPANPASYQNTPVAHNYPNTAAAPSMTSTTSTGQSINPAYPPPNIQPGLNNTSLSGQQRLSGNAFPVSQERGQYGGSYGEQSFNTAPPTTNLGSNYLPSNPNLSTSYNPTTASIPNQNPSQTGYNPNQPNQFSNPNLNAQPHSQSYAQAHAQTQSNSQPQSHLGQIGPNYGNSRPPLSNQPPTGNFSSSNAHPPVIPPPVVTSQPQPAPKISPAEMPNIISVIDNEKQKWSLPDSYYATSQTADSIPPLPIISPDVPILDDGNCSSRFMRATTYRLPISEEMSQSAKIPIAMVVQPFAKQHPREPLVPRVENAPGEAPVRCSRCRSFINSFCRFLSGGRSWECSICSMSNEVPAFYFCNLDATGHRSDLSSRPELRFGTVDFVASSDYIMRTPSKPFLLIAFEATRSAVQSGALNASIASIRALVKALCQMGSAASPYQRIAIIAYDKAINIFDMRSSEPSLLVMSDAHDPFVPIAPAPESKINLNGNQGSPAATAATANANASSSQLPSNIDQNLHPGLFFDPISCSNQLDLLFERIPTLFADARSNENCFGAVASFSVKALEKHGGRCVLFVSTIPSFGIGLLKQRDSGSITPPSSDKIDPLLVPQGDFFSRTAKSAASLGVSFTIVSIPAPGPSIELCTIGQLATLTSGRIFHYPRPSPISNADGSDGHLKTVTADICSALLKPFAFDCVLRMRAGSGLQTGDYYGSFSSLNQTDYQFAALDCDQSFVCSFFYDSKLSEGERVVFQCATLYTSSTDGKRLIRVNNLALVASSDMGSIFRMADLDAFVHYNFRKAVQQITHASIPSLVGQIHVRSAQLLAAYRKHCASNLPNGQLVLPDSFKLLPLLCLALSKSTALSQAPVTVDLRACEIYRLLSLSMTEMFNLLYPRIMRFGFDNALSHGGEPLSKSLTVRPTRLSRDSLNTNAIFAIPIANRLLIWISSQVDPSLLAEIFGNPNISAIQPEAYTHISSFPPPSGEASATFRRMIEEIASKCTGRSSTPIILIRFSLDSNEVDFMNLLVEDGQASIGPSYVDFLCRLHNQINHEMNSSSLAERTALLSFLQ